MSELGIGFYCCVVKKSQSEEKKEEEEEREKKESFALLKFLWKAKEVSAYFSSDEILIADKKLLIS